MKISKIASLNQMLMRIFFFKNEKLIILGAFLLLLFGCKKSDLTNETTLLGSPGVEIAPKKSSFIKASTGASQDSIAQKLMNDFGLVILSDTQKADITFPTYSTYEEASAYIQNKQSDLQSWTSSDPASVQNGGIIDYSMKNTGAVVNNPPAPNCNTAGTRWAKIPRSGGLLSSFNVYISTSSSGITGMSFYTTGTPIGWGWQQLGSFNDGYSGCTAGIVTWGLQVGNITLGMQSEYHWNYTFDPTHCLVYLRWGSGPC